MNIETGNKDNLHCFDPSEKKVRRYEENATKSCTYCMYQTWKTNIHNKEHKVTKIMHTK